MLISTWRSTGVKRKSFEVLFYFSEDTSFESVASLSSDLLRGNWSWLLNFCSFNKHGDICSNAVIFLEVKLKQTETTESNQGKDLRVSMFILIILHFSKLSLRTLIHLTPANWTAFCSYNILAFHNNFTIHL